MTEILATHTEVLQNLQAGSLNFEELEKLADEYLELSINFNRLTRETQVRGGNLRRGFQFGLQRLVLDSLSMSQIEELKARLSNEVTPEYDTCGINLNSIAKEVARILLETLNSYKDELLVQNPDLGNLYLENIALQPIAQRGFQAVNTGLEVIIACYRDLLEKEEDDLSSLQPEQLASGIHAMYPGLIALLAAQDARIFSAEIFDFQILVPSLRSKTILLNNAERILGGLLKAGNIGDYFRQFVENLQNRTILGPLELELIELNARKFTSRRKSRILKNILQLAQNKRPKVIDPLALQIFENHPTTSLRCILSLSVELIDIYERVLFAEKTGRVLDPQYLTSTKAGVLIWDVPKILKDYANNSQRNIVAQQFLYGDSTIKCPGFTQELELGEEIPPHLHHTIGLAIWAVQKSLEANWEMIQSGRFY